MTDKTVKIENGRVLVDGVDAGPVLGTAPESPAPGDCYNAPVERRAFGTFAPTGEFVDQFFVWNGVGWAQITGIGEAVTFSD